MNLPIRGSKIPHNLLFNKAAIARILHCPPSHIKNFQINLSGECLVATKDGLTIFTQEQMEQEFHRYRMEAGADLEAWHAGEGRFGVRWDVRGSRGDLYQVEIVGDHYRCTCEDWHQHTTRCKHGWAVHFAQEAVQKQSCHDCVNWQSHHGFCQVRAAADLEQLPITHAETCLFFEIGFEEF